MLILFKQSIKTTFVLLLFITGGTYLYATNSPFYKNEKTIIYNHIYTSKLNNLTILKSGDYFLEDTVLTSNAGPEKKATTPNDKFTIPDQLAKMQINFQINSFINYLNYKHFILAESKKLFFQAWLKEKELQKLSIQTDSLRKVYANASSEQKEDISLQILRSEQRSIVLNEEIPAMYQNAREEEGHYWQAASSEEISKFQEKIRIYKDSILLVTEKQNEQIATIHQEIPDTITFYQTSPKAVEKKVATEPSGIIYKIQIGAYKGKIPESANKLIKKLSLLRKIDNYIDDKGVTTYTTGNLSLYKEAETMQRQVKQEGIKNALITAYQNGKKITVSEARKLNNEL